ncbi:MAG: RsmB/NOP family class I SAM-dependent RNA methyltransferase, partial [Pseudomonadota bacterium]
IHAVLRRATADVDGKWDKSPVPMLPKWLRKPLMAAYGNGPLSAIEVAHMRGAPLDITVKSDPDRWADRLGGQVLPTGTVRLQGGQVSALPGYDSGDWWVQDAAASLAAQWARPAAGQTVLDLCAAPGGKTLQLAASGAKVRAVDSSAPRLDRVRENLRRTGLQADVVVGDALTLPDDDTFDTVLLDAPCSATGTIRRHPDLPYAKDGAGIDKLIDVQARMLARAARHVRPGGALVFCTCSLIPDEGEVHAEAFLQANPNFTPDTTWPAGVDPAWKTDEGGLRLRPDYWSDQGGMDGFYIIRLNLAP